MVASILPNGKNQFIDASGAPLVGGTITFYIPETTTFKDTWQDPEQTILNTNPIVLDDRGQAIIYGSGQYRQILRDANGNLIWDQLTSDYSGGGSGSGIQYGTQLPIISASTTDISTITTHNVLITGTNNISSFGSNADTANPTYIVGFSDTLTLTYNAANFILPGRDDIITGEGDSSVWMYEGAGVWQCISYTQAASLVTSNVQFGPPINVKSHPTGSSSATVTADFLIASTASFASSYELSSYSKTVDLSTVGAGGMDTGSAPTSSFVAIYAIYNPTTTSASILACAQSTSTGTLYTGSNLPSGYTASTLLGILPTDSAGNLAQAQLSGRSVWQAPVPIAISSGSGNVSILSAVPTAGLSWTGYFSSPSSINFTASGVATTIGRYTIISSAGTSHPIPSVPMVVFPYTYITSASAGTLNISGYTF